MQSKHTLGVALLGAVLIMPIPASVLADEVVEKLELGLELYQEDEYGAAITELEFAINDISKLMSGRITETFPEAPERWSAGTVDSAGGDGAAAMFGGGGSMMEREYRQEDGSGRLTPHYGTQEEVPIEIETLEIEGDSGRVKGRVATSLTYAESMKTAHDHDNAVEIDVTFDVELAREE